MSLDELLMEYPSVARRLADRIGGFVIAQDDEVAFETAEMPTLVRVTEGGSLVVQVTFVSDGEVLGGCLLDAASVGLHLVDGELLALEENLPQ